MNTTSTLNEDRLVLSGNQDVRTSVELHRSLTERLSKNADLVIDCNAIDSLDAACLQLLLAAKRESPESVQIDADPTSESARWIQYSGLGNQLLAKHEKSKSGT